MSGFNSSDRKSQEETFFNRELDHLRKSQIFDNNIKLKHISVVSALIDVIFEIPVSEAKIERSSNKHRLIHSRFKASLNDNTVDVQLNIRYN
ncbi:hypothetical protein A3Q56_01599 [Intoshia linei]|uniref:Uncharacterized protein n=1 Tax=Intoshia linei TaxID=1819745 RepID=A0A177BB08_9BILA|nr:hypothetical protein A3Q56_01599 [Intoshia linei]